MNWYKKAEIKPATKDDKYLLAVESGDIEAAQKIVNEVASKMFIDEVQNKLPSGGTACLEQYGGPQFLELADITADVPGMGWGSKAMEIITSLADKYSISLLVLPVGDLGSEKFTRLVDFYKRYDFEGDEAMHRIRSPLSPVIYKEGKPILLSERFKYELV